MSGGFIVSGKATCPVEGLSIRTFDDDDVVHRFAPKGKRARAVELIIYETVTRSVDSTVAVLKKRGLSVHLVMGADGALTQHGPLRPRRGARLAFLAREREEGRAAPRAVRQGC